MRLLSRLTGFMDTANSGEDSGEGGDNTDVYAPTQTSSAFRDDYSEETDVDSEGADEGAEEESEGDEGAKDSSQGEEGEDSNSGDESEDSGEEGKFYFEGHEVEIENDPEVENILKENGFNIEDINKEIYSKDGLTEATRTQLNNVFGKATVDLHLRSLETMNKANMAMSEANETSFGYKQEKMVNEASGGEWDNVLAWASKNMDDATYKRYADVVNGDNLEAAQMAVENMTLQYKASSGSQEKVQHVEQNKRKGLAVEDSQNLKDTNVETVGLSQEEYLKLFEPSAKYPGGEYFTNPKKFDELRKLGKGRGR